MNIYVIGSNHFMEHMVHIKNSLCELGFGGWIHPHYEALVRGEMQDQIERDKNGEAALIKRENNYLHQHYAHILKSDAGLVVNDEKHGVPNYIGGNVLIEMGQAYVNHKKIFLLNEIPYDTPLSDEIIAMDPIPLTGDLKNIH